MLTVGARGSNAEHGHDPAVRAVDLTIVQRGRGSENTVVVSGATFEIARGETLAIVGETGAGKSAIAAAVAGRAGLSKHGSPQISGGSLTVFGTELRHIGARARDRLALSTGYLAQDAVASLDPILTVGENVASPIYERDRHFDRRVAGAAVAALIDAVRLPLGAMTKFPNELSRGQRQRVALARALVLEPSLLVADNPTMGVDTISRGPILDVIRELQSVHNFSALIVAHDVGEIRRLTDNLAIMYRGMIVGLGSLDDVFDSPRHPYVDRLAQTMGRRASGGSGRGQ